MDNLIKPLLDSLVGIDGIIIDDSLFDSVEINWLDKNGNDEFEIQIEYPEILYGEKRTLYFLKQGQWCFPMNSNDIEIKNLIVQYFNIWNSINSEEDYYKVLGDLPYQNFLPYNKICHSGFNFIEI